MNDVMTFADTNAIRGKWILGRITEEYPGPDGKVSNVKVKTSTGECYRPVTKIDVIFPTEGYKLRPHGGWGRMFRLTNEIVDNLDLNTLAFD